MKPIIDRLTAWCASVVMPSRQVTIACITLTIATIVLVYQLTSEKSLDPQPIIERITPTTMHEWAHESEVVKTGLHITNFYQFNMKSNLFGFDGVIWFEFNPALISLDTISRFSFDQGYIKERSDPNARIIDGKLLIYYTIKVEFTSDLNYRRFPLDAHRVNIVLVNNYTSPQEVLFESYYNNFLIAGKTYTASWEKTGHDVLAGYAKEVLDPQDKQKDIYVPKVVYSIDFHNTGIRNALLIFLPLLIFFLLALLGLGFNPNTSAGMMTSLLMSSLTGMIAYRFVIDFISPAVGYYMVSDVVFVFLLICVLSINLFTVIILAHKTITRPIIVARGIIFIGAHLALLITWIYLITLW